MIDPAPRFGHSPATLGFWRDLVQRALPLAPTPFYLLSTVPLEEAWGQLLAFGNDIPIPVRHWLSCKTQPVLPLLRWWKNRSGGIEVVSEFEFRAALAEGFEPEQILVNGPAKHRWLPGLAVPRIRVNFDSTTELQLLLPVAQQMDWSIGIRLTVPEQTKGKAEVPAHFGMTPDEALDAINKIRRSGGKLETLHFHCGTQITSASVYARALAEVGTLCASARFTPRYLDIGGGFPAPHVLSRKGEPYDAQFSFEEVRAALAGLLKWIPGIEQIWMENGRFLSARAGVLVIRVLDVKERGAVRYLICDGGRTMNALVSLWERHNLFTIPARGGPSRMTAVCGPTCMGFDQLAYAPLSSRLRGGDVLVWMDAGAYHLPWETRFSHGHAAVLWHESDRTSVVRPAQAFESWWGEPSLSRRD